MSVTSEPHLVCPCCCRHGETCAECLAAGRSSLSPSMASVGRALSYQEEDNTDIQAKYKMTWDELLDSVATEHAAAAVHH